MSNWIDREGIFMAQPTQWRVRTFEGSQAMAVEIDFKILGMLNDEGGWDDWRDYAETTCRGRWFLTKKDGTVNSSAVDQLAVALGWDGNLLSISDAGPPPRACQINVRSDEYRGETRYNATWMNHKFFKPTPTGAPADEVNELQGRFGSLFRAAAASATQSAKQHEPDPAVAAITGGDDNLPF